MLPFCAVPLCVVLSASSLLNGCKIPPVLSAFNVLFVFCSAAPDIVSAAGCFLVVRWGFISITSYVYNFFLGVRSEFVYKISICSLSVRLQNPSWFALASKSKSQAELPLKIVCNSGKTTEQQTIPQIYKGGL